MRVSRTNDWSTPKSDAFDSIPRWFDAFLVDRRVQEMARGTIEFYKFKLRLIDLFFSSRGITNISKITPVIIRELLLNVRDTGHNHGGVHQVFRVLRAFLNWYGSEINDPSWASPMRNIKAPKLLETVEQPIEMKAVAKLIGTCDDSLTGLRDKAIFLLLLDTGLRASELCDLTRDDIDTITGDALVRNGKGRKSRIVAVGKKARRALRRYLNARHDDHDALFVTDGESKRLAYRSLDNMLRRRCQKARIKKQTLHSFRRAFALNCLRSGMDVYSLQKLMGHADLTVLRRYLAQTDDDLREAHAKASPVDNWL